MSTSTSSSEAAPQNDSSESLHGDGARFADEPAADKEGGGPSKKLYLALGTVTRPALDGVDTCVMRTDGELHIELGPALTRFSGAPRSGESDESRIRRGIDAVMAGAHEHDFDVWAASLINSQRHVAACQIVKKRAGLQDHRHGGGSSSSNRRADVVGLLGPAVVRRMGARPLRDPLRHLVWELGVPPIIAYTVRVDVVSQFRTIDVAAGGPGGPLAPVFHAALIRAAESTEERLRQESETKKEKDGDGGADAGAKPAAAAPAAAPPTGAVALLTIGGAATSVTYVPRSLEGVGIDDDYSRLVAFDCGPGTDLLDQWAMQQTGEPMDRDGSLAKRGLADRDVLERMIQHPYIAKKLPKFVVDPVLRVPPPPPALNRAATEPEAEQEAPPPAEGADAEQPAVEQPNADAAEDLNPDAAEGPNANANQEPPVQNPAAVPAVDAADAAAQDADPPAGANAEPVGDPAPAAGAAAGPAEPAPRAPAPAAAWAEAASPAPDAYPQFTLDELAGLTAADGAATLTAFVAECVARASKQLPTRPTRWLVVCGADVGGGARGEGGRRGAPEGRRSSSNLSAALMAELTARLAPARVERAEGGAWDAVAAAFDAYMAAYLAVRSIRGLPITFPGTTGVPYPLTGGLTKEQKWQEMPAVWLVFKLGKACAGIVLAVEESLREFVYEKVIEPVWDRVRGRAWALRRFRS